MAFRKSIINKKRDGVIKSFTVIENRVEKIDRDGEILNVVTPHSKDLLNKSEDKDLPSQEEYYLENLVKAGVPLKEMPVSGLLNPSDPVEVSTMGENISENILNSNPDEN